jgi:hypothetical protein
VRVTSLATGHIQFYITFHTKISHPFMHLPHLVALVALFPRPLLPLQPGLRLHRSFAFATVTTFPHCHGIIFVTLPFLSSLYPPCLQRCRGLACVHHCRGRRYGGLTLVAATTTTTTTLLSLIIWRLYHYCYRGLPLPMLYCRMDLRAKGNITFQQIS